MRRPAIIATLLLPLPFALLPVVSLLFADSGPLPQPTTIVRETLPLDQPALTTTAPEGQPLAAVAPSGSELGCGGGSDTGAEG